MMALRNNISILLLLLLHLLLNLLFMELLGWCQVEIIDDISNVGHSIVVWSRVICDIVISRCIDILYILIGSTLNHNLVLVIV